MSLVLLGALLLSISIGYLLAVLLLPASARNRAGQLFAICLGAGLGAGISSCLYFLIWFTLGPSTRTFVAAELIILGLLGAGCWIRRPWRASGPEPPERSVLWLPLIGFLVALAFAVALFVDNSRSNPYGGWDAWTIWNLRAEFLAQNDASWRNAFSGLLNRTHPDYPLLLSGFIASCWNLMGTNAISAPIAVAAIFMFATAGLLVSAIAMLRSWSAGLLAGLILLASPRFLVEGPNQYADVPLSFYYATALALTLLAANADRERLKILALAGLAGGIGAWTKNEGLLFLAMLCLGIAALYFLTKRAWPKTAPFGLAIGAAGPLLIALYFKFFLAPATGTFTGSLSSAPGKLFQLSRYWQIAKVFWHEGFGFGIGTIHPIVPLAIIGISLGIHPARRRQPVVLMIFAVLLAVLAGYFFTFVITPLDLAWHLNTSLGRLYVQLWPSFLLLAFAMIRTPEETAVAGVQVQKPQAVTSKKRKKVRV
jgi:hypothetical protein